MSPSTQISEVQLHSIGRALKSAREKRGDNIAEAAFRIALSPAQLRAIEAGDLRPFYGPNYFMQAARRYANFLGTDLPAPTEELSITPAPPQQAEPAPPAPPTETEIQNPEALAVTSPGHTNADESISTETESQQQRTGLRWGWVALAAAVLITIGVVKVSLEQPARQEPVTAVAPAPATPSEEAKPTAATAAPAAPAAPTSSPNQDGQLTVQASTWVQIVKNNGEKTNVKAEPGQKIEFNPDEIAALAFGQPDKAVLTIQGKAVNLSPFITQDSPPRALVILNRIKE